MIDFRSTRSISLSKRIRIVLALAFCLLFVWSLARVGGAALTNLGYIQLSKAIKADSNDGASDAGSGYFAASNTLPSSRARVEAVTGIAIADAVSHSIVPDRSLVSKMARTQRGQTALTVLVQALYQRMLALQESGQEKQATDLWGRLEVMHLELPASALQGRKDYVDALVRYKSDFKSAIQQYEIAILLRQPTASDLIALVALNQKAGNQAGVDRWQAELRRRFPDQYLQDLYSNPFGLDALAYTYSRYGLFDDAISLERQALDINPNFPWGNREMAAFLIERGDYEMAEEHLQTAIDYAENDTNRIQWYLSDLGDLYSRWGKPAQAEQVYCRMLTEGRQLGIDPDRKGAKPLAARIAGLAQVQENAVEQFCQGMKPKG